MAGEPKFFTRSWLDRFGLLETDNAPSVATLPRLYDRDQELTYKTSGANSDVTTVTVTATFKAGGLELARTFDTIVLLGHNLKDFTVQRWDGATWVTVTGGAVVGEVNNYTILTFTPVFNSRIRVQMTATRTANQEKEVGELLVFSTLLTLPTDNSPSRISFGPTIVADIARGVFGNVFVNLIRWAGNRVEKFKARVGFTLMAKADLDSLRAVFRTGVYYVQLEPTERPTEFFLVTGVVSGTPHEYVSTYKGQGYNLEVSLEEV